MSRDHAGSTGNRLDIRKAGETSSPTISAPAHPLRRRLVLGLIRVLLRLLARLEVSGLEHIPASGGGILILNHLSNIDPPLLVAVVRRNRLTGLVAAEYRAKPVERWFIEAAGGTWLRRGKSDRDALKTALALIEQGWIVGIAPEGRRSRAGSMAQGKRGPAFLACYANAPVYPVAIWGTENWTRSLKRLRRPRIFIRFGEPFRLPQPEPRQHKQQLEAHTELMMCHLAALLPPEYRGVYADHPQLRALLDEITRKA